MKIFPIVLACDEKYLKYSSVTIASIISNANKNFYYKIFIISDQISNENQNLLKKWISNYHNFSLDFIIMNQLQNENFFLNSYQSKAVYYRLYIPKLFEKYKRVLYLDSDIIVDQDISDLISMDFKEYLAMGITDYVEKSIKEKDPCYPADYFYNTLKLKSPKNYINAGVILFNIKKINELKISEEFINIRHTVKEPIYQDQCLLNCIFGKFSIEGIGTKIISHKYNFFRGANSDVNITYSYLFKNRFLRFLKLSKKENASFYIYHFLTHLKPWNSKRISNKLFYKYLFSIHVVKPPKEFIKQILEENNRKFPIHWKLFMKFLS